MNKEQIKEAILGQPDCRKEDTPLCQFATFHPDMEMVEVLLKGADIQKSFNNQPMAWVLQFCEPDQDKLLELLFKYKYYALHLWSKREFESLLRILMKVKTETILYVLKVMKKHNFYPTFAQNVLIRKEEYNKIFCLYKEVFDL